MSNRTKEKEAKIYNQILAGLDLKEIYIDSSSTRLLERPENLKELNAELKESFEYREEKSQLVIVFYRFKFIGKQGRKKVLEADCSYAVEFNCKAKVTETFMARFSGSVVRYLCMPYAREFISNMTSRMGLPPFYLPLFKIGPTEKK